MNHLPVDAIVVEYRSPSRTLRCVSALLEQGVARVIIVDNSDDGRETWARLAESLADNDRVELIDAARNLGFASGVNLGWARRRHPRVLLINNDAIPDRLAIPRLLDALDREPAYAVAVPMLIHAGRPLGRIFYNAWMLALSSFPMPGSFEAPRGCCMLVAPERMAEGALFDERFFMYGEELALGWQMHQQGRRIVLVDNARVHHEGSATARRGSAFYEERTALAHMLLERDLITHSSLDLVRPLARRAALFLRALLRSLRQRSPVPLQAFFKARRAVADAGASLAPPPNTAARFHDSST